MFSVRNLFFACAAFCLAAIVAALVMQYHFGLKPCPLCITQRILIIAVGIVTLIGALVSRWPLMRRIFAALGVIVALGGASVSARHVWIQHLPPDQVPSCGPSLDYMFANRPLGDALSLLLKGDGQCSEIVGVFLGITLPGWTLLCFLALALTCASIIYGARKWP